MESINHWNRYIYQSLLIIAIELRFEYSWEINLKKTTLTEHSMQLRLVFICLGK
jgi:hypothetical protein